MLTKKPTEQLFRVYIAVLFSIVGAFIGAKWQHTKITSIYAKRLIRANQMDKMLHSYKSMKASKPYCIDFKYKGKKESYHFSPGCAE